MIFRRLLSAAALLLAGLGTSASALTFQVTGSGTTPQLFDFSVTFSTAGTTFSDSTFSGVSGLLNVDGFGSFGLTSATPSTASYSLVTGGIFGFDFGSPDFVTSPHGPAGVFRFALGARSRLAPATTSPDDYFSSTTDFIAYIGFSDGSLPYGDIIREFQSSIRVVTPPPPPAVPLPAAGWALLAGLAALAGLSRRGRRAGTA